MIETYLPTEDGWVSSTLDAALDTLVAEGRPFTADDLHADRFGIPGIRPGDVGAAFRRARARHDLRVTGYTASRRPSRHHSLLRVWAPARREIER